MSLTRETGDMPLHLPGIGPAVVAGIALPHGRPLSGDQPEGTPAVLWATDEPIDHFADVWTALREPAGELGLVPLQLSGLGGDTGDRPWDSREFSPSGPPDDELRTPAELLRQWWSMVVPDPEEDEYLTADLLAPFGREFPGLASREEGGLPQSDLTSALELLSGGRLGLVAAERPADVPGVLGWHGAVNSDQAGGALSIVLRSWEERFGATLVGIGFDTIYLLVARPPSSLDAAQRVAAEYYAFCADSVDQEVGSISRLAEDLMSGPIWSFWWD